MMKVLALCAIATLVATSANCATAQTAGVAGNLNAGTSILSGTQATQQSMSMQSGLGVNSGASTMLTPQAYPMNGTPVGGYSSGAAPYYNSGNYSSGGNTGNCGSCSGMSAGRTQNVSSGSQCCATQSASNCRRHRGHHHRHR